jgi:hypothetical protein
MPDNLDYDADRDEAEVPDELSLEGLGWDILVGGQDRASLLGGENPFDLDDSETAPEAGSVDEEIGLILRGGANAAPESEAAAPGAEWDRGRGAYAAESDLPDTAPELPDLSSADLASSLGPPRDLSPADLLNLPSASGGLPTTPPSIEPSAPTDEPAVSPEPETPTSVSAAHVPGESESTLSPPTESLARSITSTPAPASSKPAFEKIGGAIQLSPRQITSALKETRPGAQSAEYTHKGGGTDPFVGMWPPATGESESITLPPDKDLQEVLVTRSRIQALWEKINQTYDSLIQGGEQYAYASMKQSIADLRQARELLVSGPQHYDEAEQLVVEVQARLLRERKTRQWARRYGPLLMLYLIVWLVGLSVLLFLVFSTDTFAIASVIPDWIGTSWLIAGFFGSLGGTVGAFWVLIKHISVRRDFDPVHTAWYVTNPLMGYAVGVLTALIVSGGGRVLSLMAGGVVISSPSDIDAPFLYVVSLIAGFNQNVLLRLIDRFARALLPGGDGDDIEVIRDEF